MILRIIGHNFHFEMENLCRAFFPYEKIITVYEEKEENDDKIVTTIFKKNLNSFELKVKVKLEKSQKTCERNVDAGKNDFLSECEREMASALFEAMTTLTGYIPSWGILTGVRPSKLMTNLIKLYGQDATETYFRNDLLVSKEKTDLSISVANTEKIIISKALNNCFSLYIAIPFCPSRCSYCSFVSHSITAPNAKKLLPKYIENLCLELEFVGKIAKELDIRPQTIYFGGGTPTSLEATDLTKICVTIKNNFDLTDLIEYTVEGGRPDTITTEKLSVLKNNGITRISINPQTFNDDVLKTVGREHSAQCTLDAYALARSIGFKNINMDLIAGLPKDSLGSFNDTLDISLKLSPENITVHTLALKRSSSLVTQGSNVFEGESSVKMLSSAQVKLQN